MDTKTMEEDNVTFKERTIGSGNFSIGSSVKGGLVSIKIDVFDEAKTMAAVQKCIELKQKVDSYLRLQGALE
jgi:hypothetical protein